MALDGTLLLAYRDPNREFASPYIAEELASLLRAELNKKQFQELVTLMGTPAAGALAGSLFEWSMHQEWQRSQGHKFTLRYREGSRSHMKSHDFHVVGCNLEWEEGAPLKEGMASQAP